MNRRAITTTVAGAAAVAALFTFTPGSATAGAFGPPDLGTVAPASVGPEFPCEWSTHNQTGKCVSVEMETQYAVNKPGYFSLSCPADHPYPFLGAFSGNPVWKDRTKDGFVATSSVRAVAADNSEQHGLSYQGHGSTRPGYVTIFTNDIQPSGEGGHHKPLTPWTVGGSYVCTTTMGTW